MTSGNYLVLADDGNQYGPISETDLRGWIKEGRVQSHNQVWLEGSTDWKPLGQHDAFQSSFAIPPAPPKPPLPARPAMPAQAVPVADVPAVPTRTVVCTYILAVLMPFIGFFLGIYLIAKKQIGHGVACMAISVFFFLVFLSMQ